MIRTTPDFSSLGVNVAGFLRGGLGLGQAARLYVAALADAGVPVRTTTVDVRMPDVAGARVKTIEFTDLEASGALPFNLVCVNAPELPGFRAEVGTKFFDGRYTIGVWAWETDVIPHTWDDAFTLVDEIWVYSRYVADVLSHAAPCPVVRVPLPILTPEATDAEVPFALPDAFTFLFLFDFSSTLARKNPLGLLEAFKRAFAPGEGPHLLLKSFNGDFKPDRLRELTAAAEDRPDVHVIDRFVTDAERVALLRRCDAYVSLHRCEGFGLTMGEAMALGKPVIATGFSGNLDFMTHANSYLVDHGMTSVGPEGEHYPAEGRWADPDLDHAAALMRRVWENQEEAAARGALARRDIATDFSVSAVGDVAYRRLRRLARAARPTARPVQNPESARSIGLPLTWLENVQLKAGYDIMGHAGEEGGLKGAFKRASLRFMRPFTYHQEELNGLLVKALQELYVRATDLVAEEHAEHVRLDRRVARAEGAMQDLDLGRLRGGELARVLDGARARPASGHPALTYVDEDGRRHLGFRDGRADGEFSYRSFEDIFRGSEQEVRARQEGYADLFADAGWVLDLGCGRGEFLDVLAARGIESRGIDMDATMVERCRQKGHRVEQADAISYLERLDDASVPGAFAAQVIEHLPSDVLSRLLGLLRAKLAPGGLAVLETVNPHNPTALKAFWTDTTHQHPLFPEVTLALCRLAGFDSGEVIFPGNRGPDLEEAVYESPDYAVVARRA